MISLKHLQKKGKEKQGKGKRKTETETDRQIDRWDRREREGEKKLMRGEIKEKQDKNKTRHKTTC